MKTESFENKTLLFVSILCLIYTRDFAMRFGFAIFLFAFALQFSHDLSLSKASEVGLLNI
jgi:hypothetical protein